VPKGLMVVRSRPTPEQEAEFNDWYDNVHIPELLAVPGFEAATRYRLLSDDGAAVYLAIYEIDAEDILGPVKELRSRRSPGSGAVPTSEPPVVEFYERLG
jgi:hypothetical protein